MAIFIHQTDDGRVPGWEYIPCSAITPKVGMALKISGGNLATATGADVPQYMSMTEREVACVSGELIPVVRIHPDIIWEVPTPSSFSQPVGTKAQLESDGLTISNTSGGACEIVYTDSEVTRFRIVQPDAE